MIDRKTKLIFGLVFLLASGFLYTMERLNRYIYWFAQTSTGEFPTNPDMQLIYQNLFIPVFLLISILFFIWYFYESWQHNN
ncbi:hypothetical protein [Sediminibacillus halophilus]|nr:hypothetical protein [Sediminibacillus halophilus]